MVYHCPYDIKIVALGQKNVIFPVVETIENYVTIGEIWGAILSLCEYRSYK